jgi:hypothetical protein
MNNRSKHGSGGEIALFLLAALLCAGCRTPTTSHSEFASRIRGLTNLVILPIPAVGEQILVLESKPAPFPHAAEFSQQVREQMVRQLEGRGFKVAHMKLPACNWGAITNGFEDRTVWMQLQLQRAYQSLARYGGHARGNILRPEGPLLAEYEAADGLVFISVHRVTESAGARSTRYTLNAVSAVASVGAALCGAPSTPYINASPEGCSVDVALVEGRSGVVLWRSWVASDSPDGLKPGEAVKDVFASYPK